MMVLPVLFGASVIEGHAHSAKRARCTGGGNPTPTARSDAFRVIRKLPRHPPSPVPCFSQGSSPRSVPKLLLAEAMIQVTRVGKAEIITIEIKKKVRRWCGFFVHLQSSDFDDDLEKDRR